MNGSKPDIALALYLICLSFCVSMCIYIKGITKTLHRHFWSDLISDGLEPTVLKYP